MTWLRAAGRWLAEPVRPRNLARDLAAGFAIGAGLASAAVGGLAALGYFDITRVDVKLVAFVVSAAILLLSVVVEELVFRGLVFRGLEAGLGSWTALALGSLLFGVAHLVNPDADVVAALAIAVQAGVLLTAAYLLTRTVWLAIGIHFGWNLFEAMVFGAPISGAGDPVARGVPTLLHSVPSGPEWLTGGGFGPERSPLTTLLCLAVGVVLLRAASRRGAIRRPRWAARRR